MNDPRPAPAASPDRTFAALEHRRCPICGACWWLAHPHGAECSHCRLIVGMPERLERISGDVARRLAAGGLTAVEAAASDWSTDDAGARNLAWRFRHEARRADSARILPDGRPMAVLTTPAEAVAHHVTLAMIARADDPRADALMAAMARAFPRRLVLLDAASAAPHAERFPGARVEAHPLGGDFAAQRNRLQALAGAGWVLQVDSDEVPDAALVAALGWLTAAADRDGLRSLGLPRRNLVDGALSALYPDIQYRLNRADVRFANRVHERPTVPFEQTSLALVGALDHHLSGERVRERSRIYEAMSAGAGRGDDERLLLTPFDPIALR